MWNECLIKKNNHWEENTIFFTWVFHKKSTINSKAYDLLLQWKELQFIVLLTVKYQMPISVFISQSIYGNSPAIDIPLNWMWQLRKLAYCCVYRDISDKATAIQTLQNWFKKIYSTGYKEILFKSTSKIVVIIQDPCILYPLFSFLCLTFVFFPKEACLQKCAWKCFMLCCSSLH